VTDRLSRFSTNCWRDGAAHKVEDKLQELASASEQMFVGHRRA